jgi:excisionase family DNA binding protein
VTPAGIAEVLRVSRATVYAMIERGELPARRVGMQIRISERDLSRLTAPAVVGFHSMAAIKDPLRFSAHFGIRASAMARLGVLDPTLNVDTRLFIDPLLLVESRSRELNRAAKRFRCYFEDVATLLAASRQRDDVAWRSARAKLAFSEVKGTCLGYGGASISGSGFGPALTDRLLLTAKEIVDLGVRDPHLFLLLALLEEDVGPDRISDMTTNVILPDLAAFAQRIAGRLRVPTTSFNLAGSAYRLPANPLERKTPVFLVPTDILRDLPIAADWSSVASAAAHNSALRQRINERIGAIWEAQSRRRKTDLRQQALASRISVELLLDALGRVRRMPYDLISDPQGLIQWRDRLKVAGEYPLSLTLAPTPTRTVDDVLTVVRKIVEQFRVLVEQKGLWKNLWCGPRRRPEKAAQMLFFAVADSYCKANDLDLSPETDSGGGPVDFKMAAGARAKALVEIKLSSNSKVVAGYTKQLEAYKAAEEATRAVYLVIDVGAMGTKDQRLVALRNRSIKRGEQQSELVFVDGKHRRSASKL